MEAAVTAFTLGLSAFIVEGHSNADAHFKRCYGAKTFKIFCLFCVRYMYVCVLNVNQKLKTQAEDVKRKVVVEKNQMKIVADLRKL